MGNISLSNCTLHLLHSSPTVWSYHLLDT